MPTAVFRFSAELNDFLPRDRRGRDIEVTFNGHETVKHLLESLGVPHTEVDVILVDGVSVDFRARLNDKSRVEIYPGLEMSGRSLILTRLSGFMIKFASFKSLNFSNPLAT